MLPIPTLDQAHHSHRAAWDTQLPPSSLHSTHIRHTGTELHWNIVNALLLMLQNVLCSSLWEPGMGHENVLYNHIFQMSSSQVSPLFTDWGSGFQVVPILELDLKESASTVSVVDLLYFHSLLDMVQTDQCIFFNDSL